MFSCCKCVFFGETMRSSWIDYNFLIPAATFPHLSPTRIYELSYREKLSILKPLTKVLKYFCY